MSTSQTVPDIKTLGALKESGYQSKSIKEELRQNLIAKLQSNQRVFDGIVGFDNSVLPEIERAILSRHNILLLGLRGQAKTRIARLMTQLLDPYIPVVSGTEINDDPLAPLSRRALDTIDEMGDDTPIQWMHRSLRFVEKLATPDVSVADLIGDVDPIKAATLKLTYADDRVIHFGLVPRAHRSIFVLNELPDLQARIQVSLFNILQEGDLQIRGFKWRFPLDIQFIFTANPEDYTNRGSIVTPLKDRIESQILTHYPQDIETARIITSQESQLSDAQKTDIYVPDLIAQLLEYISFEARESPYVDKKSGVSARLSISAMENLLSTAERRMLVNKDTKTAIRISDFWGVIPSITGKIELEYEGEQEGSYAVALDLINKAIQKVYIEYLPNPDQSAKSDLDEFLEVRTWFANGNHVDLLHDDDESTYRAKLDLVPGLDSLINSKTDNEQMQYLYKELILHGLAAFDVIGKTALNNQLIFMDPLAKIFDDFEGENGDLLDEI